MNWGKKITIVYLSFVALVVTLVVVSMRQKVDLVTPDYYAKELNYQSDINKMKNANTLSEKLQIKISDGYIVITFPPEHSNLELQGSVLMYKPSDNKSDKTISLKTNNGEFSILTKDMTKGMYKVKVDWKTHNKEFQSENVIVLN